MGGDLGEPSPPGKLPVASGANAPDESDTMPIVLIVCEHSDSPWCPRCAGGVK